MSWVYDFIFFIFSMAALPKFLLRLKQTDSPLRLLKERFGVLDPGLKRLFENQKVVWLHAVSVGEVMAARPWTEQFLKAFPDWTIALSVTTPTGFLVAQKMETSRLIPFYAPFDFHFCVRGILKAIQPKLIVLMETELWPNLIGEAHRMNVPVGIMNGRISPRALKRYRWIGFWTKSILMKLSFCLVQSQRDLNSFTELGMPVSRMSMTGNMKFDFVSDGVQEGLRTQLKRFFSDARDLIFIAGSTHQGEEETVVSVYQKLKSIFPALKLVLAPRHPERLGEIFRLLQERRLNYTLYSKLQTGFESVLVLDQMGILAGVYEFGHLAFIGGSLIPHGGQNPIEAAQYRKAVLHGPNVFNFEMLYACLDDQKAAFLVRDEDELFQKAKLLLEDRKLRAQMGEHAFQAVASLRGATRRNLDYVRSHFFQTESLTTVTN